MVDFHCLEPERLELFLLRRRASASFPSKSLLADNLVEVLRKANEFVPSAAGSILLDNPTSKLPDRKQNELFFIASFGESSEKLVGDTVPADSGIAGHVYVSGRSYYSSDVSVDAHFYSAVDEMTRYRTQSLVAIPIRIEREVCGVLELINRQGASSYSERDLDLLEIFASYIAVSIQNVLDARHAQEIAKLDNLTGLHNDRYLHIGLFEIVEDCKASGDDVALLFLDLDYFKQVNDTHGHLAGSQVLREVGGALRELVPHSEALLARYGGDEFVLVVPGMGIEEASALAEGVRAGIAERTFLQSPGDVHPDALQLGGITCSVGVASLDRSLSRELPAEEIKRTLLRLADTAMYGAKGNGRNRVEVAGDGAVSAQSPLGRTFHPVD